MSTLAILVLSWMVALQNPNDPTLRVRPEVAQSYPSTAQEIAAAAAANPLPGATPAQTARLLVVMAQGEGRFDPAAIGDSGASLGMFQVSRHWGDSSAANALRLMRISFQVCKKRSISDRLGWYMFGGVGCDHRLGLSRYRFELAKSLSTDP
jgi:hypothetical protein